MSAAIKRDVPRKGQSQGKTVKETWKLERLTKAQICAARLQAELLHA